LNEAKATLYVVCRRTCCRFKKGFIRAKEFFLKRHGGGPNRSRNQKTFDTQKKLAGIGFFA
jgi:hypothetical protein